MSTWKKSWGRARQVTDDLWRVRLQHSQKTLVVNTYVYRASDVLAVIDPGWPGTLEGLEHALGDMDLADGLGQVDYWLYTHAHIDHMGPAALIEARSDAPHLAWSGLSDQLDRWHAFQDEVNDWSGWIAEAFVDPHRSRLLAQTGRGDTLMDTFGAARLTRTDLVDFGQCVEIGELTLEFVDARGHDPHHGAWWEPTRGWLFSGDAVIAAPTPICRAMDDDLAAYRATLDRLEALDPQFLLPGHGLQRRERIPEAFERSRGFVDEYTTNIRRVLRRASEPLDLYAVSLAMTPKGRPLRPTNRWWVHMALVDSHLQALVEAGQAEVVDGPRYRQG